MCTYQSNEPYDNIFKLLIRNQFKSKKIITSDVILTNRNYV